MNFFSNAITWKKISHGQKFIFLAVFFSALIFVGGHAQPALGEGQYGDATAVQNAQNSVLAGSGLTASAPNSQTASKDDPNACNLNPLCYVKKGLIQFFTWVMLSLTTLALRLMTFVLSFVITIASYNDYLKSTAVNVGWVLIRDLTNMVFVVALLLIAFGTILGLEKYEWKQMLFKLVSAAILVNFSRTICGLIIDAAQVVMITFVNGISATIGGNFIQAFSLDKIRSFSNITGGSANINITDEGVFIAAMAALFIAVTILVITGILLAMLIGRVIILWVLIVLSPIAFVLSVLPQTQKFAAEWWSQFTANVITGPILIFFLWLTLVTVGNGNINKEIVGNTGNSNLAQEGINFTSSAGIGAVLQWDLLVNFCIAIGFLLVGIKVTQELRGFGSSMVGKAAEYGKRAVYYGSGAFAAKAGGQLAWKGVKAGAKIAAMEMPIVGGKFWKRRFDIRKAKVGTWWDNHVTEPGLKKAEDKLKIMYEKKDDGSGKYKHNWYKRLKAKASFEAWSPNIAKEKYASDATDVHEKNLERLTKHTFSTKGSPLAEEKGEADNRLKIREKTGARFQEGFAVEREEDWMNNVYGKLAGSEVMRLEGERDKKLKEGETAEAEAIKKKRDEVAESLGLKLSPTELEQAVQDTKRINKIAALDAKTGFKKEELSETEKARLIKEKDKFLGDKGAGIRAKTAEAQANAELGDREIRKQQELTLAIQKDAALPVHERRFEMAVRASHNKEIEDQLASLTFREKTAKSAILGEKMVTMTRDAEGKQLEGDALDRVLASGEFKKLAASQASTLAANFKNGQEFGMTAFEEALKKLDLGMPKTADDFVGFKRQILSALSGYDVGGTEREMQKGEERLKTVYGPENFSVIMRNVNESIKKTAASGGVNLAGFIDDSVNPTTGLITYRFRNTTDAKDLGKIKSDRAYWAQENNISQVATLKDILGKDKDGNFAGVGGEQAKAQLISVFGTMKRGSRLHNRLGEELRKLVEDGTLAKNPDLKKEFKNLFGEFSRKNPAAASAFLSNVSSFGKEIMKGESDTDVDVRSIKKALEEAKVDLGRDDETPDTEGGS